MSDLPPPPPPGGDPVPPPPPDLHAPSYQYAPQVASAPLKRVGGLSRAAMILVGLGGSLALISVLAAVSVEDDARAFLDGETTNDEFLEAIAPFVLVSFVQVIAIVASAVIVIIWMYRIAANHRAMHRTGTWGPGWAIGGWFLPPLLYIIPYLMFRELWKASDPAVPAGGDWRSRPVSPAITAWFVLYSVIPILLLFSQTDDTFTSLGADERDLAESLTETQGATIVSALVTVAGAVAFIVVVRQLTERHRRLTGELR